MTIEIYVENIYRKVMGTLLCLSCIKKNKIPVETRITVVQALALSIMSICSNILSSTNNVQIQKTNIAKLYCTSSIW